MCPDPGVLVQDAETRLLDGLLQGEPWALERFYRDYAAQVLAWALRLGAPDMDAEDLAHEVFLTALKGIHGFRGDATLSTWLFGITRRTLANARRKQALRRLVGLDRVLPAVAHPDPDARQLLEAHEARRQVQAMLQALPQRQREVLVLLDMEERSGAEVAQMLGIPLGTVYSRLHSARRALGRHLGQAGWQHERAHVTGAVVPLRERP